ncbi:hypothetical protein CGC45_08620 [Francisella opportunistica]|nr:hypothetical protein CGC45_08620 [Francisella opportunistica]
MTPLCCFSKGENQLNFEMFNNEKCIYTKGEISVFKTQYLKRENEKTIIDALIEYEGKNIEQKIVDEDKIFMFTVSYKAPLKSQGTIKFKSIEQSGLLNALNFDLQRKIGQDEATYQVLLCYMENDPILIYIESDGKLYGFPTLVTSNENIDDYWVNSDKNK